MCHLLLFHYLMRLLNHFHALVLRHFLCSSSSLCGISISLSPTFILVASSPISIIPITLPPFLTIVLLPPGSCSRVISNLQCQEVCILLILCHFFNNNFPISYSNSNSIILLSSSFFSLYLNALFFSFVGYLYGWYRITIFIFMWCVYIYPYYNLPFACLIFI